MSDKPVVVVGAGNAGLAAAYELYKKGIDFVVLEATDRYGGRVGRADFEHGSYSLGAYFTEPQWGTTFEYLTEFDLMDRVSELTRKVYGFWLNDKVSYFVDDGNLFGALLKMRGLPLSLIPQGMKFLPNMMSAMKLVNEEEQDFSGLAEVSQMSAREWVTKHGGDQIADKLLGPMLRMMVLAPSDQVSAAHPIALMKLMKGMCLIDGGLKLVNDNIYERIKDHVRLNTPVQEIVIEDDEIKGVKLVDGEFIETNEVVCATDAVDALALMPNLPEVMKKALETCEYSKTYHYVFWREKRLVPDDFLAMFIPESSDIKLSTIFDENSNDMPAMPGSSLMHAFTAGWMDEEFTSLDDDARAELVLSEIDRFYPGFSDGAELVAADRMERAINLEAPGQYEAIQDLINNHFHDVKGLHLGGEYLFLIASSEGAWRTGKAAGLAAAEEVEAQA